MLQGEHATMDRYAKGDTRMYHFQLKINRWHCLWACVCMFVSVGCQTLSFPAIDPTGNRIFSNDWTGINPIHGSPSDGYPSQQPAYQTPPEPPPCVQGNTGADKKLCKGCLSGKGCLARKKEAEEIRGRCGQLLLTPTRIVAPVGGEVILLAGVCGKDEYLVTNEPIEWMLSPRSVGEIVEVGDDAKGKRKSAWSRDDSPKVEKLAVDFARGRTSSQPGLITKGTANKADDLPIRKGQTWISLTSTSEGISKVTALAPDSDVWDKRRQTATIYWVDASWEFPKPMFEKSGNRVLLNTKVWQADRYIAAQGWKVRYRTLNPEFAKFVGRNGVPNADIEVDIVDVDANANASVEIVNGGPNGAVGPPLPGTAWVEIEIISPSKGAEIPELQIAKGTTSVTWSAPMLNLEAVGPPEAVPGQPIPYFVSLANLGDEIAENATISVVVPNGMQLESASFAPQPQTMNNTLQWIIGPLEPRRQFDLNFSLVAAGRMDARVQVTGTANPNLQMVKSISTFVQNSEVSLEIVPRQNQTQVEINAEAAFEVKITNTGKQTINNIDISLTSVPGLRHIRGGNESTQRIDFLPPGQSRVLGAVFVVQQAGELVVTAEARTQSQVLSSARSSVQGIPATPKVPAVALRLGSVPIEKNIPVGAEFKLSWIVSNTGAVPLSNVVVSIQHDPSLVAKGLSQNGQYEAERQLGRWNVSQIAPGGNLEFEGMFQGVAVALPASIRLRVETNGLSDDRTFSIGIGNAAPGSVAPPSSGDVLPNNNLGNPVGGVSAGKPGISNTEGQEKQLKISVVPVSNAVKLGEVAIYEIRVESLRNQPHQQVAIEVQIPKNLGLESIRTKDLRHKTANEGKTILFEPIQYLRGSDVFSAVVQLKVEQSGSGEIVALVSSKGQTSPAIARLQVQPVN